MKEVKGDIFRKTEGDAICIISNGYVKLNGEVYVEHGIQKEAAKRWPKYRKKLGHLMLMHGTHVIMLTNVKQRLGKIDLPYHVVNFPVKPSGGVSNKSNVAKQFRTVYTKGTPVPGWAMRTSMNLLKQSARELRSLSKARKWKKVYIQKPNGVKWGVAKVILDRILDDRFYIVESA